MKKGYVILAAALAMLVLLAAACSSADVLTGAKRDAVLAYSEARTTNLLNGINANNYAAFSQDFGDKMKSAMTEAALADLKVKVTDKIGQYVSRQVDSVVQTDQNITVIYLAKFENEEKVTVRVVFDAAEPHLVSGLWFDSEKLRK